MLKYNDKVIVIKDEENDGFYVGLEGRVMERVKNAQGQISYAISFNGDHRFGVKEDEVQKI